MPDPASPEIIARVSESYEYWNDGEPQLMLRDYAEDARSRCSTSAPGSLS